MNRVQAALIIALAAILAVGFPGSPGSPATATAGQAPEPAAVVATREPSPADETMLMLIGETTPTTTVASRQPETPQAAPALVTVIGRETIQRRGYRTLGELLAEQPGFFLAAGGRGSAVYLRGLRNSVLFLYDGVPITTDVTKNIAPLDHELSLLAVERVEIVRGPGSVLWGPDAYAGVVNIVPRRGRRSPGWETELAAGTDPAAGVAATWSGVGRQWDAFVALAGNRHRFQPEDYRFLTTEADGARVSSSEATEAVGSFHYQDWLRVSGRWSDFTRRYTMREHGDLFSWDSERETPVNHLKLTLSRVVGPSHYTLTGFLQQVRYRLQDADVERQQRNRVQHLEFLYDRRLMARGLLTAGVSWRRNRVNGAMVRDGFLPEFLDPEVPFFQPRISQESYTNQLLSVFAQFRGKLGAGGTEWWLGGRLDDHDQYRGTVSYSLGINHPLSRHTRLKASWGSAYRSPYAAQLFDGLEISPESIRTASAQLRWSPDPRRELELTLYHSRIADHRAEDPYGGLSQPANHRVYGLELAGRAAVGRQLELDLGLAVNTGARRENFRTLSYAIIRPDGSRVDYYDQWDEPVDRGAPWQLNLGLTRTFAEDHSLRLSGLLTGPLAYSYDTGRKEGEHAGTPLVNLTYRRPGFFPGHDTLTLRLTNLLDRRPDYPDLFGPTPGPPFTATLVWRHRF